MEQIPIDKLRLRFPDDLEEAYQEESYHSSLKQLRINIIVVAVIYALFGIVDVVVTPDVLYTAWFIRYAIIVPAVVLTVALSYSPQFRKYQQTAVSLLVLVGGVGVVALIHLTHVAAPYLHFAGLLLVFMTCYTAFKLRFLYATAVCWTIIAIYEVSAIWISHIALPVFLTNNFFFVSINLMGMFTNYQRELYARKDFFRGRMMQTLEKERHIGEKTQMNATMERAIQSLKESEEKFRTLAETAAMAIFIHQGGNFLYANRAGEVIGGYTVEEYLTMNFLSLVHPDFLETVTTRARERLGGEAGVPAQYEFKIVRKNGEERWVLMTAGITEYEGKPAVIGTLIDIAARKQAEEERYRMAMLIENSSDFIGMATLDGNMLFINSAGRKLVGLDSTDDVKKTTLANYFMPEDLPALREELLPQDGWRGEFRLRHMKTGQPIPVDLYGFSVTDEKSGRPIARATVIRDITDLKKAQEERERYYHELQMTGLSLKESEAKFRSLTETAPAAIFIHQGGNFLYANEASVSMLGYTREEFLAMDFWGVTHPDDKEMIIQRARARISGDPAPLRYEFRVITKSGEVRWVDMTVGTIEYEGKPAVIGNAFDITARKRAEEERERYYYQLQKATQSLLESEARFRTLAETTSAGIFIHRGGKLVYVNPAGEKIVGYTREEFLRMDFWEVIHPEHRDLVRERGRARLAGAPVPSEYEFKMVTKTGEERWVGMTAGIIEYEGNSAVIATIFDVTDRTRAEEEKARLYEERIAEEKRHVYEKEKILMDLHDGIGGITTNISILSELGRKSPDVEGFKKTLATISQLSREGISEIRGFMHSLDSMDLNWRTLAAELRNQGTILLAPHNISFELESDVVDGHEQPSSLLWVNLFKIYKESLTNIIKHSKAGIVKATLQVTSEGLLLTLEDNGIGLGAHRGSGRGLSHMKRRAEEIGGTVIVSSGKGASVRVDIPLPIKYPEQGMAL